MVICVKATRVESSLNSATVFSLSPTDMVFFIRTTWICWPVFYTTDIDGDRLLEAMKRIEKVYPLLCGRLERTRGGLYQIKVDPDASHGFGFVEVHSDMSLAEIRSSSKMMHSSDPCTPMLMNWPFYLDAMPASQILSDASSLMGVHLVHVRDGCVFSVAIKHVLCDGERYGQLMIDISRAYRGWTIHPKQLDRSFYWPDNYISQFPKSSYAANAFPRNIKVSDHSVSSPKEPSIITAIHFSKATIKALKDKVRSKVKDVEFLSTNDLIAALHWLFKAELRADTHRRMPVHVNLCDTAFQIPISVTGTAFPIIPRHYFGNAVLDAFILDTSVHDPSISLLDVLARAASRIHKAVDNIKRDPQLNLKTLLQYYHMVGNPQSVASNVIGVTASYAKMPYENIDFGSGAPVHVYGVPPFPFQRVMSSTTVGPRRDGIILYMFLTQKETEILMSSRVFAECTPTARIFPKTWNEDDALEIMGLKSRK